MRAEDIARFWSKVDKRGPDECWEWKAARQPAGYGKFWLDGKEQGSHRVALIASGVEIPAGYVGMHKCDNPPCCNPNHLLAETASENQKDKFRKGRGPDHCKLKYVDHAGKSYGSRWTFVSYLDHDKKAGHHRWNAVCSCGKTGIVYPSNVIRGLSKSCGCHRDEKAREACKVLGPPHLRKRAVAV